VIGGSREMKARTVIEAHMALERDTPPDSSPSRPRDPDRAVKWLLSFVFGGVAIGLLSSVIETQPWAYLPPALFTLAAITVVPRTGLLRREPHVGTRWTRLLARALLLAYLAVAIWGTTAAWPPTVMLLSTAFLWATCVLVTWPTLRTQQDVSDVALGVAVLLFAVAMLLLGVAVLLDGHTLAGVAMLLIGVAGLLAGVAFLLPGDTLFGVALLLAGVAGLLLGVAGLLRGDTLFGVSGLLFGITVLLLGVAVLLGGDTLLGVAGLLLGVAGLLLGVAGLLLGVAGLLASDTLFGVSGLLLGVAVLLLGVAWLLASDTLFGVAGLLSGVAVLLGGLAFLLDGGTLPGVAGLLAGTAVSGSSDPAGPKPRSRRDAADTDHAMAHPTLVGQPCPPCRTITLGIAVPKATSGRSVGSKPRVGCCLESLRLRWAWEARGLWGG
jgi:hypothetical protein